MEHWLGGFNHPVAVLKKFFKKLLTNKASYAIIKPSKERKVSTMQNIEERIIEVVKANYPQTFKAFNKDV